MKHYDVMVIGAGHAGCEAAYASARLGASTALVTINLSEIGKMPCNPAIGGPGKSQIVREIDALGGMMGQITDQSTLNIRLLNTSKGRAMQVRRAQADRDAYKLYWKRTLEHTDGLDLIEGMVDEIMVSDHCVSAVRLREGLEIRTSAVIIASGTFLNGEVLIGNLVYPAGRTGEPPSIGLAESLRNIGLRMSRLKTGTTPRVNRRSIDTSELERQSTSDIPLGFSFWRDQRVLPDDFPVYVSYTNEETHAVIRDNLSLTPNFNGLITSEGPRHCPSLEAKIVKFPERSSHKVFLEPEGRDSAEVYLQGIYTAFPPDIQDRIVHSIRGLEHAQIERYGYDIQYDYVDPVQLAPTLELDGIKGLYLAGQVNGTTGYEEAAGQGLIAGVNAARLVKGDLPFVISRTQAFIGVMIDDLVTKGVTEPYRMLPSRAEYRITLREGNADLRLAGIGHEIGLLNDRCFEQAMVRKEAIEKLLLYLKNERIGSRHPLNEVLTRSGTPALTDNGASLYELLRRPPVRLSDLINPNGNSQDVLTEVEIEAKYSGYLEQQEREIERLRRMEKLMIPEQINYSALESLSIEGRDLLSRVRPRTFGQASRIPGVAQADLSMLAIILRQ
ncbi:MAG: tRNA uridine-5-carboxymethylaminomethyl(34) synthesis enzyme MnmG [Candidatus Bipolaricaulota bacterium]|nr:tRNA uridine-5-carboxymethylaminomethyl(34) synthesis enzyme MnmG [Candidatus Bipolaricaulota bacterium]